MKKSITTTLSVFILVLLLNFATPALANDPAPPPPPGHGQGGNVPGGGAPVGEGLIILVALGAAYGYKKWRATEQTAE
jgi:hypothetical protein